MSNYASILYLPPASFGCSLVTLENLKKFPPAGRFILYSDYDWSKHDLPKSWEFIGGLIAPEKFQGALVNRQTGISNGVWAAGMRLAARQKVKYALYLESDCRVGTVGWDALVFDEYFNLGFPCVAAGSLVVWHASNGGLEYARGTQKLFGRYAGSPAPILAYGSFPGTRDGKPMPCNPSLFPNGAAGVYNVQAMLEMFSGFKNMVSFATGEGMEGAAWDYQVGEKLRQHYGSRVFEVVAHLKTVFSTYKDHSSTKEERLNLLRNGTVAIAHEFKGKETI